VVNTVVRVRWKKVIREQVYWEKGEGRREKGTGIKIYLIS